GQGGDRSTPARAVRPPAAARPWVVLRIGILQWAAGGFCGLMGALTFVAPHQFVGPTYALLQPGLPWWGLLCLLGGGVLLAAALLAPRRSLLVAAHALAAAPIVLLAVSAGTASVWSALVVYLGLGIGTAVAPFVMPGANRSAPVGDLFAVVVGASAVLNGTLMLALPGSYQSPVYNGVRPYLAYYGAGFVLGGLGVVWTQPRARAPRPLFWATHLLLGLTMVAYGPPLALTARAFTSIAYYVGFGLLLAGQPWLRPRLRRSDPHSLRTRLALAFGLAVSVPLVLTMALVTDQIERSARTEALARTQIL